MMESQKMTKKQVKSVISGIKQQEKLFLGSRENANSLVELLSLRKVQSDNKDIVSAALGSLVHVFTTLFNRDAMTSSKPQTKPKEESTETTEASPEEQYKDWLHKRYKDCLRCISRLIEAFTDATAVQELALCSLMKLLQVESNHPLKKSVAKRYAFPADVLNHVVRKLLSRRQDMTKLIARFQEYLEYDDVRFFVLAQIKYHATNLNEEVDKKDLAMFCTNMFALLEKLTMPTSQEDITNFLCKPPDEDADVKVTSFKEHRKLFSDSWLVFLGLPLPPSVYKKTLVILHDAVMPHMTNPLLLTDFLTFSYNIGGAVSLLALNGLFVLISQHNLEYPQFYKKLYALFEPSIFHVKFRARFFHLADLFLSSTYLPAYLVAACAKRLSRLALTAPPAGLMMVIPFVCNLLLRHRSCRVLIQRTDGPSEIADDPYIMDETDPAKSKALESSLWELETLKSHYHPGVATAASKIDKPFPKVEWEISEYLELSTSEMIDWVVKKKMKTAHMEFEPPKGLIGKKDDTSNFFAYD
ncbi:nucleolar complex protein 4 homolog isoform X1 [Asterias rubens]|uniref:nucleolar complex protein 4 homolog isoform X1 n=2 Tax=Asterias rubens TaxID=7604 RepID=UPI0014553A7C|nr:nucleolar complex protein 4 homolog isoform X1 [Asterias rubens]